MKRPVYVHPRGRRGMAVPVALLAVVVIGAIITSAFFGASQQRKIAASMLLKSRAFAAAENAQKLALVSPNWFALESLSVGTGTGFVELSAPAATQERFRITRLQTNLYLIVAEGRAWGGGGSPGGAVKRTGMFVRLRRFLADSADSSSVGLVAVPILQRAWAELF